MKKSVSREGSISRSLGVLILCYAPRPQLHCTRAQQKNIKPSCDIFGMEECKMSAQARDKMFRHQQGAFSFPELQFSRGELRQISFCLSLFTPHWQLVFCWYRYRLRKEERQRELKKWTRQVVFANLISRVGFIYSRHTSTLPLSTLHNPSSSSLQLPLASTMMCTLNLSFLNL